MSFSDIPAVPNNPWPELLSTNVAPTSAQADVIRAGVDIAEQGIPLVDSQLARLRRIIQELTTHRQQLQDFASAHRSVLSVLRQVPEDVWTEILLSAIPTQTRDRETQARRYKHLCELSSVCRSWCNIIVCSPAFWTEVYVGTRWEVGPPPSVMERRNSWDTGPRLDNLAQRTALQLARSGQMPLKVHVDIHALHLRTSSANYPSLLKLLDLVLDHSSQLRETTWTLSYTHLQHIIESGASFPQLESLTLQLGGGSFPENVNQLFGALPRLVQYMMDFIDPLSHLPSLDLPWAQLQKCELRHCPLLQVAGILPLLGPEANVVLYRCGSGRTAGGIWNQGAILSHIQSLVLTSCDERHARWLLEFLVAPRLKKLSIQIGTDAAKTLPLQGFLTRSRCQLTHVAFSVQMNPGRRTNSDEIAAVLSGLLSSDAVSSVTHLDCRTSNRRLFLQLLTEDGGSGLLPCLKTLTLRGEDFAGFVPALREYLVSRGPAAPIVWIDRLGVPSTTLSIEVIMFERKLQGWRDSGMEFDVRMPVEAIPVPHLSPLWAT